MRAIGSIMYLDKAWLTDFIQGTFLYPASGTGLGEIELLVPFFRPYAKKFIFNDLFFPRGMKLKPTSHIVPDANLNRTFTIGDVQSSLTLDNRIRHIEPSLLVEQYFENWSSVTFEIVRRRGFGHFALNEQPPKSISIFVHRGDSPGESGSNQWFFSNSNKDFKPLSQARNRLYERLQDKAIVVSDGSLVDKKFLRRFHRTQSSGEEAFTFHEGKIYDWAEFQWEVIGWLGERYGPTLIWGLTRKAST